MSLSHLKVALRRLLVVHDHLVSVPVGDLGQVAHCVFDGDGSVGGVSRLRPPAVTDVLAVVDGHAEAHLGKDVLWLRKEGQAFGGSGRHDDATPPGLSHAVVARLEDGEGGLVAHLRQGSEAQLQHHVVFERGKVADVLQDEETGPVVVAVL